MTYLRSTARLPVRHWAAGSGRPHFRFRPIAKVRACFRSATLSPLVSPRVGCAQCRLGPTESARPRPQSMTAYPSPGRGAGRPQCRPRANCDGCAYPDPHTLTRAASAPRGPRRQWAGGSGGLLDRSRRVPSRPGHVRLRQSFSKPPDPPPPRAAVPNSRGFRPALLELASQYTLQRIMIV